MNELQKRELEILKCFVDVCDKLGLKYYLVCGSALGAVKYGGFIPWDDDVDVALVRDEYERFLKEAPAHLPDWMFLQNYRTDPEFPMLMTKLRDSRTTFIEEDYADIDMHHGIGIDVFPLDGYPRGTKEQKKFDKRILYFSRRQFVKFRNKRWRFLFNFRSTLVWILYKIFGYCKDTASVLKRYEAFIAQYPIKDSDYWCNHANWQRKKEYALKEQYGDGIMMKFEGLSVRVPAQYDAYLRQKYGDYLADLPLEKQISHHKLKVVDVRQPYEKYIKS